MKERGYQVTYMDMYEVQHDHFICLKYKALKLVSRALRGGCEVTVKKYEV
jgi:hypothetical protein